MDFALTPIQTNYRDCARDFADTRLAPDYQAREQRGSIEKEIRHGLGQLGLIAPEIPERFGGRGLDRLTSGIVTEEIARGDFNVAYLQVVGSLVGQILAANGRPEVASTWVPKICSGEEIVGIGLTEPHAGSDAGMPRLRAVKDGDGWVLNGVKSLSFGRDAAAVVVFARTSEEEVRGKGISAFLVPLDLPGVTREAYPMGPFELMDLTGIDIGSNTRQARFADSGDPADLPSRSVAEKIERGELGRKTGKGWYEYDARGNKVGAPERQAEKV